MPRNSLSNSPCPLGRARGPGARPDIISSDEAIKNKPFQCSYGCDSPQRRRTAARVEQGDLFKFDSCSSLLISFDSDDHEALWRWLLEVNIPDIDLVQDLYAEAYYHHDEADLPYER